MTRRVIQICSHARGTTKSYVAALCDDGTVWTIFDEEGEDWLRLPNIPQGDAPAWGSCGESEAKEWIEDDLRAAVDMISN